MNSSARRILRTNIRTRAANNNDGDEIDILEDNQHPRRRSSVSTLPPQASTTVIDALTNEDSKYVELAQYLLIPRRNDGVFANIRRSINGNNMNHTEEKMKSMRRHSCDAYSLALEPIEIRSERVIMLAEAYAVFGGLFLGGTWVLYEWGSPSTYELSDDAANYLKASHMVELFQPIMSMAIGCNLFLALWSSSLWVTAIVYGSRENFVFEAKKALTLCKVLMGCTAIFTALGYFIASWLNTTLIAITYESGNVGWIGLPLGLAFTCLLVYGFAVFSGLIFDVSPLAFFHQPRWVQFFGSPGAAITSKGREKLRERAKAEAKTLEDKAFRVRDINHYSWQDDDSIRSLLRQAAINLGRPDYDVSTIETRLGEDWFTEKVHLNDSDVELLSRYMSLRLAKEVHRLVEIEFSENCESVDNPTAS